MKNLSLLTFTTIFIINCAFSYGYQSKRSFEDVNLTPDLEELIDADTSRVLFLFGIICVGGCPIGNYIQKIKNNTDVVYILPQDSNKNDIFNFKRGLQVKGKIVVATLSSIEFIKLLAKKMALDDYKKNFILELKNKKIVNVESY